MAEEQKSGPSGPPTLITLVRSTLCYDLRRSTLSYETRRPCVGSVQHRLLLLFPTNLINKLFLLYIRSLLKIKQI